MEGVPWDARFYFYCVDCGQAKLALEGGMNEKWTREKIEVHLLVLGCAKCRENAIHWASAEIINQLLAELALAKKETAKECLTIINHNPTREGMILKIKAKYGVDNA